MSSDNDFFDEFGRRFLMNEPPKSDPRKATEEELGAEPIKNGPEAVNHLAWCKLRALGEIPNTGAVMSSLMQDFADDERTIGSASAVRELMFPLAMIGEFERPGELRKFILGF
jgi:hypothetical protein